MNASSGVNTKGIQKGSDPFVFIHNGYLAVKFQGAQRDGRTRIRQPALQQEIEPLHAARAEESRCAVETVLSGAQHRETGALWGNVVTDTQPRVVSFRGREFALHGGKETAEKPNGKNKMARGNRAIFNIQCK
jgi:hypothetical protein